MSSFAFFGTPYVARDTLAALLHAGYRPAVVVTSPPAPKGRGLILTASDTEEFAREHGIPVLAPAALDDAFLAKLAAYGCAAAIVVAYGKLLPQAVIDAFPHGIYNVHYSLLPKYRGASPVESALLAGETVTGITLQRLALAMDAGDVIAQAEEPIREDDTTLTLRPRLIGLGSRVLVAHLPALLAGTASGTPQDASQATRAGKFAKADGELSLAADPLTNWRTYRALAESPGTYFYASRDGQRIRVKVARASFTDGAFVVERIVPEGKPEQDFSYLAQNGWMPE